MVTDEGGKGVDVEQRRDGCADRQELGEKEVIGRMRDWDGGYSTRTGKERTERAGREVK